MTPKTDLPEEFTQEMLDIVWEVMGHIRSNRFLATHEVKMGSDGEMDDVVTSADTFAQALYLNFFKERYPHISVLGEEDALHYIPEGGSISLRFTVDPLDGTKAFRRQQSYGVGTMVALIHQGEVIASFVGDVLSGEIFYHVPHIQGVFLSMDRRPPRPLAGIPFTAPHKLNVLLKQRPDEYDSPIIRALLARPADGGLFKDIEISSGSIGLKIARLLKGEIAGLVMAKVWNTPWDTAPVVGLCREAGFVFLRVNAEGTGFERFETTITTEKYKIEHDQLIIHESHLGELGKWVNTYGSRQVRL